VTVRIQFDPNQDYQKAAVQAVLDLFDGQPPAGHEFGDVVLDGLGVTNPNRLLIDQQQLVLNLQAVQQANGIVPTVAPGQELDGLDFTVEAETGTGKSYIYIRTMLELHRLYGWSKFLVVVPSVAIREGTLANLELLHPHFQELFSGLAYRWCAYDSKRSGQVSDWARSAELQIMVITIDAFNKDSNLIRQAADRTFGVAPIDQIRQAHPVVILDEPQEMESDLARQSIADLNPLCTLRYSATHRRKYHPVYRLGPAEAYRRGLVKRLEVWSVTEDPQTGGPWVALDRVQASSRDVVAYLELDCAGKPGEGPRRRKVRVKGGQSLQEATGRDAYAQLWVDSIHAGDDPRIHLSDGQVLRPGEHTGANLALIQRAMIRTAVREHLDRELDLAKRQAAGQIKPTKVLTLFFIDRVANYAPDDAPFRQWFEQEYDEAMGEPQYASLSQHPVQQVHGGYFSGQATGRRAKDSTGYSSADREVYDLIMRDKQRLLDPSVPLRFLWSHSALRQGWDNPNVMVICTLNQARSEIRRRQEVGRGLRLPVMSDGQRCADAQVARLSVVANEGYAEYVAGLQQELGQDWERSNGAAAVQAPPAANARLRRTMEPDPNMLHGEAFAVLWQHLRLRTRWLAHFSTPRLIEMTVQDLHHRPALRAAQVHIAKAQVLDLELGRTSEAQQEHTVRSEVATQQVPDLVAQVMQHLPDLSRHTAAQVIAQHPQLAQVAENPQQLIQQVVDAVRRARQRLLVPTDSQEAPGVVYEPTGERWADGLWEEPQVGYEDRLEPMSNNPWGAAICDTDEQRQVVRALGDHPQVVLALRLPQWFQIDVPGAGAHTPSWAVVTQLDGGLHPWVLETRTVGDRESAAAVDQVAVRCAELHCDAVGLPYAFCDDPGQVLTVIDLGG
jgi:type III restriction enzyme